MWGIYFWHLYFIYFHVSFIFYTICFFVIYSKYSLLTYFQFFSLVVSNHFNLSIKLISYVILFSVLKFHLCSCSLLELSIFFYDCLIMSLFVSLFYNLLYLLIFAYVLSHCLTNYFLLRTQCCTWKIVFINNLRTMMRKCFSKDI